MYEVHNFTRKYIILAGFCLIAKA